MGFASLNPSYGSYELSRECTHISSDRQRDKRGTRARHIEHDHAAVELRGLAGGGRPVAIVVDRGAAEPHAGRSVERRRLETRHLAFRKSPAGSIRIKAARTSLLIRT